MSEIDEPVEFSYYEPYMYIALREYKRAKHLEREMDTVSRKKDISDDEVDFISRKNELIELSGLVAIVFCAMALESYINHYVIERLSKSYLTKYLDKLDLVSKWLIVPRLVTGKSLDPGSRPMQNLSKLVSLRNRLVHHKTHRFQVSEMTMGEFLWIEDVELAVKTVQGVVGELAKIDERTDKSWTLHPRLQSI